jgi:hypothetical protein
MVRRESELSKPGAIERERQKDNDPQLGDVIDRYVNESKREIRRTKGASASDHQEVRYCRFAMQRDHQRGPRDLCAVTAGFPADGAKLSKPPRRDFHVG